MDSLAKMNNMPEAALAYAKKNSRVIPCCWPDEKGKCACGHKPPHVGSQIGKAPLINNWTEDASSDPEQIRKWWARWPDANIGILTDELIVIDVDEGKDTHGKDKCGLESKAAMEEIYGDFPQTKVHLTGGGGQQWLYSSPEGVSITGVAKLGGYENIDLRAKGGQIIVPPSLHRSGKRYEVIDNSKVVPAPDWVAEMRMKASGEKIGFETPIEEGQRDVSFTSLAGIVKSLGGSEKDIYAVLKAKNSLIKIPLPDKDLRKIARSIGKKPPEDLRRTDTGNAMMLADLHGDRLRYDHIRKLWLILGPHIWRPDADGYISRLAVEMAKLRQKLSWVIKDKDEKNKEFKWGVASESKMRVDACVSRAKDTLPMADTGRDWDKNIMYLGAENGVIDLPTGLLLPGKPEYKISMSVGQEFDPEAICPRWEQFLTEIFDDPHLIDWISRALGYTISGETSEQIVLMGYGRGGSGMSTFRNAIYNSLGDYSHDSPFSTFSLPVSQNTSDVRDLHLKRFVGSSEVNAGTKLNSQRIKVLSGGDPVSARFLYKGFETFTPHLTLWLFFNHRPDIDDDTFATWRRVRLIEFPKKFFRSPPLGDRDKILGKKLFAERQGILTWLVRWHGIYLEKGLDDVPACIRSATNQYRRETDTFLSWLDDQCILDKKDKDLKIRARSGYTSYASWAKNRGIVIDEKEWGIRMESKFAKGHDSKSNLYRGVGLRFSRLTINLSNVSEDDYA